MGRAQAWACGCGAIVALPGTAASGAETRAAAHAIARVVAVIPGQQMLRVDTAPYVARMPQDLVSGNRTLPVFVCPSVRGSVPSADPEHAVPLGGQVARPYPAFTQVL